MLRYLVVIALYISVQMVYAGDTGDIETAVDTDTVDNVIEQAEASIEELEEQILSGEETAADAEYADEYSSTPLLKDVFLVLDNSGSMKKNDPDFLASEAVREFISMQDENTRVGIVVFDQSVRLSTPLTEASLTNRETILSSLNEIDYKGLFTDSPAGIERAIYQLKNNARDEAEKSIIFMTDGIVDTGNPDKDIEKAKWLREDLAPDAADNDIKIFAIAFTEQADFQLIQSIAQKTGGEYYRALQAEDLRNVFERIDRIINEPPEPEPVPVVQPAPPPPPPVVQPAPAPVIIEVPSQAMGEEERIRSMIMIAAAIILSLTLLAILFLLIKRNKEIKGGQDESVQEAYINDLSGKTMQATHKLGARPTMFGRVAGQDTDHLDYIVVNETTIGRRHALIEYKDYAFWIVDQGSINGTFVNGEPVKTETRLKHGDKIRLHKCEFEFVMPEMDDSGMTVVSNTVFAAQAGSDDEEATLMKDQALHDVTNTESDPVNGEMDFDLTGGAGEEGISDLYDGDSDEEATVLRDLPEDEPTATPYKKPAEPEFTLDEDVNSEDDTIMIDDDEDATLMPGDDQAVDDATLRKDDD
ncbi:MAG: VWA domain-containing protein [Gammaproteobacteria bacterium]